MRTRYRQNLGLVLGFSAGGLALIALLLPGQERWHARGPMNSGHAEISCDYCHRPARGSLRQQIQANARYLVGLRATPADFGLQAADNDQCLACHERPNDRHPVFRFNEPRFQKARQAIHPETCTSCHTEHRGVRTTLSTIGFCRHCHEDTRLKNDPVEVSHLSLIDDERWDTCLRCHDFHGNHVYPVATAMDELIPLERIRDYLAGGASPYGDDKVHEPREVPEP